MLHIQKKVTYLSQWNDVKSATRSFDGPIRLAGLGPNTAGNGSGGVREEKEKRPLAVAIKMEVDSPSSLFALSSIYPLLSSLQPSLLLAGVICSPSHLVSRWLCSLWWPTSHKGTAALPLSAFKTRGWYFAPSRVVPKKGMSEGLWYPASVCQRWSRYDLHGELEFIYSECEAMTKLQAWKWGILTLSAIGHAFKSLIE